MASTMNVVLYMRYSSDKQTEQSIEGQERVCTEFCERNGYNIVGKYIDRGKSAYHDVDKRTEFLRMIDDSSCGMFTGVVIYKFDRFARDRYVSATYKHKLKQNGVSVISATENINDTPEGILLESVIIGMSEFYSKELSQKVNRGMRESAYKGKSTGGQIAYGYSIVNKEYVINEQEAEIVRDIFRWAADGLTKSEIISKLSNKRTRKGTPFKYNTISSILRNEKYIGIYKYTDIIIDDAIPPIVDKETFEKAQRINGAKPSGRQTKNEPYILTGKLYCGKCKHKMVGESGYGKHGELHQYYNCQGKRKKHICDTPPLRKHFIENIVQKNILKLFNSEMIEHIADICESILQEDRKKNSQLAQLKDEWNRLDKEELAIVDSICKGMYSERLKERNEQIQERKAELSDAIEEAQSIAPIITRQMIVSFLTLLADDKIETDLESRKKLIDILVDKVYVYFDDKDTIRLETTYKLFGKTESVTSSYSVDQWLTIGVGVRTLLISQITKHPTR